MTKMLVAKANYSTITNAESILTSAMSQKKATGCQEQICHKD